MTIQPKKSLYARVGATTVAALHELWFTKVVHDMYMQATFLLVGGACLLVGFNLASIVAYELNPRNVAAFGVGTMLLVMVIWRYRVISGHAAKSAVYQQLHVVFNSERYGIGVYDLTNYAGEDKVQLMAEFEAIKPELDRLRGSINGFADEMKLRWYDLTSGLVRRRMAMFWLTAGVTLLRDDIEHYDKRWTRLYDRVRRAKPALVQTA